MAAEFEFAQQDHKQHHPDGAATKAQEPMTQTQGKVARGHQTLNNRILLRTIDCPAISNRTSTAALSTTMSTATTRA